MALDLEHLGTLGALAVTLFLFGFLLLFFYVLIQAVSKSLREKRDFRKGRCGVLSCMQNVSSS